jgi:hypothetical protein
LFGQLVLMSPWLRFNNKQTAADGWGRQVAQGTKIYIEMGTDPGDNYPVTPAAASGDAQQLVTAHWKRRGSGRDQSSSSARSKAASTTNPAGSTPSPSPFCSLWKPAVAVLHSMGVPRHALKGKLSERTPFKLSPSEARWIWQ